VTREEILKWLLDNDCVDLSVVRWAVFLQVPGAVEVDQYIKRERREG
jgi:hypothetical protein